MTIKKIVALPLVMALIGLSGCQPSSVNKHPNSPKDLVINHASLSHLSSDAIVSVTLDYKGEQKNQVRQIVVENLPFHYNLKDTSISDLEKIEVEVKIGNQVQLRGSGSGAMINMIQLSEVSSQPLTNTFWKAVDISGRGIPLSGTTTLAVLDNGKLSGYSGCNQYRSNFSFAGSFIDIKEPLLTRKICSSPVMYHENRYLQLLQSAEYFEINAEGRLNLFLAESDKPIIFEPTTQQAVRVSLKSY
ncbi:META domain-containing protein [Neptuniibacter caesariensis]|uniref:DUF306 domain-containing protein n=1 Tax=Neptuniibacter caesariensis TaxID=207954 RepID=A0A7U8C6Y7_NEPCE|nr:META domain-containing protein [Neptuniibacter caesariensis]EAR61235.1 hypothetical protein MED92_10929 [Oceanospirillum sp. MED92] [Neptuniibacter caesariensis]